MASPSADGSGHVEASARHAFYGVTAAVLGVWALRNAFVAPVEKAHVPAGARPAVELALRASVWMIPPLLYLRRHEPRAPLDALAITPRLDGRGLASAAPWAIVYLALAGALSRAAAPGAASAARSIAEVLLAPSTLYLIVGVVLEELLMRGFVLGQLLRWHRPWRAQWATALLFAMMHLPGWIATDGLHAGLVPSTVVVASLGLVLALLRVRSRSLVPAVVVHAVNNLMAELLGV